MRIIEKILIECFLQEACTIPREVTQYWNPRIWKAEAKPEVQGRSWQQISFEA